MTDFKVGDRVKVEFEGVVQKWKEDGFVSSFVCVNGTLLQPENLTLLERAKPELEVGQVYKFHLCKLKIIEIGEMVVGAKNLTTDKNIALLKSFFDDQGKLITEAENG